MREVRVYDRDFPTPEQMLAGGPGAAFPKEVWLQRMQPGEFAVRYKHFKTGIATNPDGKVPMSSQVCRVFPNLEEARADSHKVVHEHWIVCCFIYDHSGAQIEVISNTKQLTKYAAAAYAQILLGVASCTLAGMALIWLLHEVWLFLAPSSPSAQKPFAFGWLYWASYAVTGFLLVVLIVYLRFRWIINLVVFRTRAKLRSAISPEDKKCFQELNYLHLSSDPAERERFLKLSNQYQEKIREALKN